MDIYKEDCLSMSHTYEGNRKHVDLKADHGRGRKLGYWIKWLYLIGRADFDKLRSSGLKFSPRVLLLVAKNALLTNPHATFQENTSLDSDSPPLIDKIMARWVQ